MALMVSGSHTFLFNTTNTSPKADPRQYPKPRNGSFRTVAPISHACSITKSKAVPKSSEVPYSNTGKRPSRASSSSASPEPASASSGASQGPRTMAQLTPVFAIMLAQEAQIIRDEMRVAFASLFAQQVQ